MANLNDLVSVVAEKTEFTKRDTEKVIRTVFTTICDKMVEGEDVSIPGFGKFVVTERAARTGRNPQTGEEIEIPASKVPKFKASKLVKEQVK